MEVQQQFWSIWRTITIMGHHRCNLAQDSELEEGVYAYVDIASALRQIENQMLKIELSV